MQFARAGTYYLYMRFTMFENGGNLTHYLNEDSFFVPPDFGKDPQTDWPLPRGGYAEGCCDIAGYLYIKEGGPEGTRVNHSGGDEAGPPREASCNFCVRHHLMDRGGAELIRALTKQCLPVLV